MDGALGPKCLPDYAVLIIQMEKKIHTGSASFVSFIFPLSLYKVQSIGDKETLRKTYLKEHEIYYND